MGIFIPRFGICGGGIVDLLGRELGILGGELGFVEEPAYLFLWATASLFRPAARLVAAASIGDNVGFGDEVIGSLVAIGRRSTLLRRGVS